MMQEQGVGAAALRREQLEQLRWWAKRAVVLLTGVALVLALVTAGMIWYGATYREGDLSAGTLADVGGSCCGVACSVVVAVVGIACGALAPIRPTDPPLKGRGGWLLLCGGVTGVLLCCGWGCWIVSVRIRVACGGPGEVWRRELPHRQVEVEGITEDNRFILIDKRQEKEKEGDRRLRPEQVAGGQDFLAAEDAQPNNLTRSPDGKWRVTGVGRWSGPVRVEGDARKVLWAFTVPKGEEVLWVQFDQTGSRVLYAASREHITQLRIFDASTGSELQSLTIRDRINSLRFSPDGNYAGTTTKGNASTSLSLWRLPPAP
jgi:hypothetical protein